MKNSSNRLIFPTFVCMEGSADKIFEVLKRYWGFTEFRPVQERIIRSAMAGRDTLALMPTGGGKSLTYQVPGLAQPGLCIVVTPLIALMKDQVDRLRARRIPAVAIHSGLSPRQIDIALDNCVYGDVKFLYVAPERLATEAFRLRVERMKVSLLAVDEAHCISQWGYDFRPSYLRIAELREKLPGVPVLALTASATKLVAEDIMRHLRFAEPHILRSSFARPNLSYSVRRTDDKNGQLLRLVQNVPGSGIVYVRTREGTEQVADMLRRQGVTAAAYHGGMGHAERSLRQEEWVAGRTRVMVATNAFGMGIDKSDVRYVIHYNMPKDMESYYQEAGRAGRDGAPSSCILLYSGQDVRTNEFLITHSEPREDLDPRTAEQLRERDLQRLRQMTGYCRTRRCLRQYILHYFGEHAPDTCSACYNCLHNFEEVDVSRDAKAIVACIAKTGQHFGVGVIAETLCGADTERVRKYHMDREDTYGALGQLTQKEVQERIRFLLDQGVLELSPGQYPVLRLTERAEDVMYGESTLQMKTLREDRSAPARRAAAGELEGDAAELLGRLRALRAQLARRQGVPAYVVFSDKTLREMAISRPRTTTELRAVSGVGSAKAERYGRDFLTVIQDFPS